MKISSAKKWLRDALIMVAVGSLVFVSAPLFAAPTTLDQLMHSLAKTKSARATFVEKKYLSILDRPVESSGELLYTAPDRLIKATIKPKPETLTVEGDTVTIDRAGRKRTLQLQEYPELESLLDSIRGTLAGNRAALERSYQLKLEGDSDAWMLSLKPSEAKIAANIHLIQIEGGDNLVHQIEVIQTDGDRSVMTITPASPR